ncbi:tetratricopeptide repeat protein [candidate division KSB1 bacterium]|nr:tetratricopeptide repeat protein [candidate division KSB1 bacterium]
MQLPEGSVILIIIWGMAVLILWNLYHFGQALRKKTFIAVLALASAGLLGGIVFLHFHQSPNLPGNRIGLVIFPLAEEADGTNGVKIDARGFAIADMIGERLQQTPHTPFYQISTDALLEAAHQDSLADLGYALRFAEQAELPVIGFGTFKIGPRTNHHDSWQANFQLFDLRKTEAADAHAGVHLKLPQQFGSLQEMTAELARVILHEWTGDEKPATAVWQDRFDDELLQRYYAVRLTVAADRTEPALQQARALLQTDPDFAPFANLYGCAMMAHLRRKTASKMEWEDSLRSAVPWMKRAAKRDSLHGESSRLLGEMYIRLEKWNEAERALLQARRREPTDSEIYLLLGQLHVSRLEPLGFRNELDLYEYARRLNPINIDAGLAAAEYLLLESREKEALGLLEQLHRLNPNHPGVLMSLGRIYIVKGDAVKIFEVYERILALQPSNADAYYNLGIAYYNRDDFENAVKLFERAIALNNHPDARMYLAQICERQGQIEKAIAYLRERIKLSRGDDDKIAAEARRHLYEILLARGGIPPHLRPDSLKK